MHFELISIRCFFFSLSLSHQSGISLELPPPAVYDSYCVLYCDYFPSATHFQDARLYCCMMCKWPTFFSNGVPTVSNIVFASNARMRMNKVWKIICTYYISIYHAYGREHATSMLLVELACGEGTVKAPQITRKQSI